MAILEVALAAVVVAALAGGAMIALRTAHQIGIETAYGVLLWTLALACWLLAGAEVDFRLAEDAGQPSPPFGLTDALAWAGWLAVSVAFLLILIRETSPGTADRARRIAFVVAGAAGGTAAAVALLQLGSPAVSPPGSARWVSAVIYLSTDAWATLLVAACAGQVAAVRSAPIGKLFAALSLAIVLHTAADVVYFTTTAPGSPPRLITDVLNALAAATAIAALAWHWRRVETTPRRVEEFGDPSLLPEQRELRDVMIELRGVVGSLADEVVHDATRATLARRHLVSAPDPLRTLAPAEVWRDVLQETRRQALARIGFVARGPLERVAAIYEPELGFVAAGGVR